MKQWGWKSVAVVLAVIGWGGAPASAHMRDYLVNQDYYTAKRGEFEVELYNDYHMPNSSEDGTWNSNHEIELEYGILDHLQLSYYEVYTWDRERNWERNAFKIESKLRFAEAGQWPVDVAIYGEYKNPNGSRDAHSDELEGKLILHKDLGQRWGLVANLVAERQINAHEEWQMEYTAGVSYAVAPTTRLALEFQQSLGDIENIDISKDRELYVMPTVAVSITPNVRVLAGPMFGLTRVSEDLQFRSIVEVEF